MRKEHLIALLAALLFNISAQAALDQSSISSTSGFVGAYGGLQGGSNAQAGADLELNYLMGSFIADEDQFATGPGSAAASTSYSVAPNTNSNSGTTQAGILKFHAMNSASNAGFSTDAVNGGWNDLITISNPALTGTDGIWLLDVDVSGAMGAAGFAGAAQVEVQSYKDNGILSRSVPGFDDGGSDPLSTTTQFAQWGISSEPNGTRVVNDFVRFAVPFTFGDQFTLGVYAMAHAGKRSSSGHSGISTSHVDFLNTIAWGGTVDVMVNGLPSSGFTIGSASGVNWLTPIPIPPAIALFLGGLALISALARRRT